MPGGSSSAPAWRSRRASGPRALGTDTGGSIGSAAFCGIVGLKPNLWPVSRAGVIPLSWSLDHVGPMTRTRGGRGLFFFLAAPGAGGRDAADPPARPARARLPGGPPGGSPRGATRPLPATIPRPPGAADPRGGPGNGASGCRPGRRRGGGPPPPHPPGRRRLLRHHAGGGDGLPRALPQAPRRRLRGRCPRPAS